MRAGVPERQAGSWRVLDGTGGRSGPGWDGELTGAWRRSGRALGGGPLAEPTVATWLQVGSVFADLRRPDCARCAAGHPPAPGGTDLDAAQAFSGRLEIRGASVRFHHDLDTLERAGADAAALTLDEDELVEAGEGYVELWRRVGRAGTDAAGGDETAVVEHADPGVDGDQAGATARLVRVGGLAIAVWSAPRPGGLLLEQLAPAVQAPRGGVAPRWWPSARVGHQEGAAGLLAALALLDDRLAVHHGPGPPAA